MAAREPGAVARLQRRLPLVRRGRRDFRRVSEEVARHAAIRGNVETEIAGEESGAGCGCAYPLDVSDDGRRPVQRDPGAAARDGAGLPATCALRSRRCP